MKWEWSYSGDSEHEVVAEYNPWTARLTVSLDGVDLGVKGMWDIKWSQSFDIDGRAARVTYLMSAVVPDVALFVSETPVEPAIVPRPVPKWVWFFVAANVGAMAIGLNSSHLSTMSAGGVGAVKGAMIATASIACGNIARSGYGVGLKLALCALVTGLHYVAIFAIVSFLIH